MSDYITLLNNTTSLSTKKLLKLFDEWYSKPKQCRFWDTVYRMTEKTISRFHVCVSLGSAETLVRRGGIANHHLTAYSLSNISAKNYQNRLMCIKLRCATSVSFFETQWVTLLFGQELLIRTIRLSEWQITRRKLVLRPKLVVRSSS